ncbi:MAG: hypothetical protein QOJ92_1549 [Frankiales bacterium]|nr:hypothetical protein [Frankiales bacterium]
MAKKDAAKIQPSKPGASAKAEPTIEPVETDRTTRGGWANHSETSRTTRGPVNHNETTRKTRRPLMP